MTEPLFTVPGDQPADGPVSRGEARNRLVRARIVAGTHPLGRGIPLHPEAPRTDTETGPTCGTCKHREQHKHHGKTYAKCVFGNGIRASHSETSDVRAWWPACHDYQEKNA